MWKCKLRVVYNRRWLVFGDRKRDEDMKVMFEQEEGAIKKPILSRAEHKHLGKVNYTCTVHINKINMFSLANDSLLK